MSGGSGYAAAVEAAEALTAAGMRAVVDPRSAVPPCIIVGPPTRTYDLGCGYSAAFTLVLLSPGQAADAFAQLDEWLDQLDDLVDIETATPGAYQLNGTGDPLVAYTVTLTPEAIAP